MIEVRMKNRRGEKITPERALKILKRKMEKEGVFDELKERRDFVPESEKRRVKKKRAKMMQRRVQRQFND